MVTYIILLLLSGLIIGALGRLVVPGPNRIGIGLTIVAGLIGSLAGTAVGASLGVGLLLILILQVVFAALCVALLTSARRRSRR